MVGEVLGRVADAFDGPARRVPRRGRLRARVPAGVVVEKPIVVLHWSDGDGLASFPHTLVVAEEGSEVTVLDRFGSPDIDHFVDGVVELIVEDNAHVKYLSVQEHGPRTWSIVLQRAHVGKDATLRSSAVALGGEYARLRSEVCSRAKARRATRSRCTSAGDQMHDFRTIQDHDAPHTNSDLLFKGAVEGTAGRVHRAHPGAARGRGGGLPDQSQPHAERGRGRGSVPNLEIETNDVKCSHASTVGPIDPEQRFYLESRGVPPNVADRLIVLGFFDEVLDQLPAPALVAPLRARVADKLDVGRLVVDAA